MVDTFDKLLLELERCLMGTARRLFTDEFKREAVGLLASSGRPLSQIAQELGIAPSRLRAWRNRGGGGSRWRGGGGGGGGGRGGAGGAAAPPGEGGATPPRRCGSGG